MSLIVSSDHNPNKHHSICVPDDISVANIEILRSRGAPVYIGTELAILHFQDESVVLTSKMSGVVNRVCVDDNQVVYHGQQLLELRNTNVHRDKSGKKMEPTPRPALKPTLKFYAIKSKSAEFKTKWKAHIWHINNQPIASVSKPQPQIRLTHFKGLKGLLLKLVN